MPSTQTPNNRLTLQATGENSGTWGSLLNSETISLIDTSLDGAVTLALVGASSTLTISDGAAADGRNRILLCTGTPGATHTVTIAPNTVKKWYVVQNNTTGGFSVIIAQGGGSGATVTVANGLTKLVRLDGTGTNANVTELMPNPAFGGAITVTGASTFSADLTVNGVSVGRGGTSQVTNTRLGTSALAANTTGVANTAVGVDALAANTVGILNTAVGYGAAALVDGQNNAAFGYQALSLATTADNNAAFGTRALLNATGGSNTAVGVLAGYLITTGIGNTLVGRYSGTSVATSNYNIMLSDGLGNVRFHINSSGEASVGSGAAPVANLALDVPSTTKAFRPPVMTTTQRNALTPVEGGVIYNSTTKKLNFYNGTAWEAVTSA